MGKREITFASADGKTTIAAKMWEPEGQPRAILQIVHGMVEFIDRYDDFASFLADKGIVVVGHDQLAHGASVTSEEEWGHLVPGQGREHLLADIHSLRQIATERYGSNLPFFLLGHSMGSFLVRVYLARYGMGLSGAIVSGTAFQPPLLTASGNLLARALCVLRKPTYRSSFLNNMGIGGYNKRFEPARTTCDWLSKDEAIVDAYVSEPRNQFVFTVGGYTELTGFIGMSSAKETFANTPRDLPILIMSGTEDPVGDFGAGPRKVHRLLEEAGVTDVTLVLYEGDRHEILNELDRRDVYDDVLGWMELHL